MTKNVKSNIVYLNENHKKLIDHLPKLIFQVTIKICTYLQ